ncbi:SDR family NAD(P)-dependent oxidoreductase [Actinoplanes teichomyceticus]|uniref:Short-subunit dehydrogenase n=1 Tax=Actinoplanes teichomyceticus TaxID=1867 RepID=A0A561WNS6_ACTTI|nr:SDR family NAD(P)-dependent oxidoreductase [Actinoplanes teichomyceticus]TWG25517.1 short-subunit dehydrogenase [Actinoplanes teichomyceticus]GIF10587.1 putative short-chain dehydrogenase/reductase [Actinoplanes teichomyceticus]
MAITWNFDDMPDQTGRTVVVTGASSGLGLVLTRELARRGASVVMAVRDVAKADRVRAGLAGDLEVREIDLGDLTSVRRFADRLRADGRTVDVLVNNAGIGAQQRSLTPQGYERVFATNHLGAFALTGLLLDLFRPGRDPRVVAVASNFYKRFRVPHPFRDLTAAGSWSANRAYTESKLANVLFGAELDRRLRQAGSPVRSFVAHPGMATTPMHDTARGFVQRAFLAVATVPLARTAEQGTLPLAFAATSPDARTGVVLGPHARKTDLRVHFDPVVAPADDPALAERLWRVSEDATGVRYLSGPVRAGDRDTAL